MSTFKESHTINIDDSENVITFARKVERNTCEHKHIEISAEDNEVLCTDCNVRLNPIWWIEKYLKHPSKEPDYRQGRKHSEFVTSLHESGFYINALDLLEEISLQLGATFK